MSHSLWPAAARLGNGLPGFVSATKTFWRRCRCREALLIAPQQPMPAAAAEASKAPPSLLQAALQCVSLLLQLRAVLRRHEPLGAWHGEQTSLADVCQRHPGCSIWWLPWLAALQVQKERKIACYAQVTALAEGGTAATVQLALMLDAELWEARYRWQPPPAAATALFLHLAPPGQPGSYLQQLRQELAGLREPPAGADPFWCERS